MRQLSRFANQIIGSRWATTPHANTTTKKKVEKKTCQPLNQPTGRISFRRNEHCALFAQRTQPSARDSAHTHTHTPDHPPECHGMFFMCSAFETLKCGVTCKNNKNGMEFFAFLFFPLLLLLFFLCDLKQRHCCSALILTCPARTESREPSSLHCSSVHT